MRSIWKRLVMLLALMIVFIGWFLFQLLGPSKPIVVSKETTFVTEPLADDGLPNYPAYMTSQLAHEVAPEDNGAIPFLQALWPADIEPEKQAMICEKLGMELPTEEPAAALRNIDDSSNPLVFRLALRLLAMEGIEPPHEIKTPEDFEAWKQSGALIEVRSDLPSWSSLIEYEELDAIFWKSEPVNVATQAAHSILWNCYSYAWPSEVFPELAALIDESSDAYELLHDSAKRPNFYYPTYASLGPRESIVEVGFANISSKRSSCRLLGIRAMKQLGEGNCHEAWSDVQAIFGIANRSSSLTLIDYLVNIGCLGIGYSDIQKILHCERLDRETAAEIRSFLHSHTIKADLFRCLDIAERIYGLSILPCLSGQRVRDPELVSDSGMDTVRQTLRTSIDWNSVAKDFNSGYDGLVATMRIEPYPARAVAIKQLMTEYNAAEQTFTNRLSYFFSRNSRSEYVCMALKQLLMPAFNSVTTARDRMQSQLQLLQVASVLAEYRIANGQYPVDLATAYSGTGLKEPLDYYHGKPLSYQVTEDGYLLYSFGPNGIDDLGSENIRSVYLGYNSYRHLPSNEKVAEDESVDSEMSWRDRIPSGADDISIRMSKYNGMNWDVLKPKTEVP